jgi:hypothetical protein
MTFHGTVTFMYQSLSENTGLHIRTFSREDVTAFKKACVHVEHTANPEVPCCVVKVICSV